MSIPAELLAWHYAGGLLCGGYECPDSVPDTVTDERVRFVMNAVIAVASVDDAWPVDVRRVADVLYVLGVFDDIGGAAFLIELIQSWSERVERGRILGALYAHYQIAMAAVEDELATNDELAALIQRRSQIRAIGNDALAALLAAEEAT